MIPLQGPCALLAGHALNGTMPAKHHAAQNATRPVRNSCSKERLRAVQVPLLTMAKGARPAFMVRASMSARGGGIEPAAQPPSSAANSTAGGRHAGTGMPSAFASSTGPAWASLAGAASMRVSSDSSRGAAATCLESSASLPAYPTAPTSIAPLPCYYIGGWELLHSDIVTVTSGSVGEAGGGAVSNISGISA